MNASRRWNIKHDYYLISVDTNTWRYDNDSYILATQAKQVFYINNPKAGGGWKVIQRIQYINVWDVPKKQEFEDDSSDDDVAFQENSSFDIPNMVQVQNNDHISIPYCLDIIIQAPPSNWWIWEWW